MAPPVRSLGDWRASLLVCDDCDAVLSVDGTMYEKRYGESTPDDLAPHYRPPTEHIQTARATGWQEEDGRWSCPPCSSKRAPLP